jgi:pimeloyl-ACP methyl ester carboxylesterase
MIKGSRAFTATRIVALAVIGVLVTGLVYLGFGGDDAVSVPAGAKAGDLSLYDCTYPTEAGDLPADCGTLVVAENASNPGSRLIALPIVRVRARSGQPGEQEPIFRLQGGPGISNMPFLPASRYAVDRDFVLVGYRGVDGSVRLECPEVISAVKHSTDLTGEASFQAFADGFRACRARFDDEGIDVTSYGLSQQVDDLEAARKALGYERINLVSESVGTRTAMIYAWRHPERIHRSVMIAANPPGNFLWDPETTDEQIARYAAYCSKDAGCRARTPDLAETMHSTEVPDRWMFLPIDEGNVRSASHYGLMVSNVEAAPLHGPMTIDAWLSAADGDASGFWFQSLLADFAFPTAFVWGQYASAASLDDEAANEYFAPDAQAPDSNVGYAATAFGWGGGRLGHVWPVSRDAGQYGEVRPSEVETLVVGGELDFAIPPQKAHEQLLPKLENGQEVLLPGFGHSEDFWYYQPEASARLINTFVASGEVDDSLYRPQPVDFTPEVTLGALAKGIAGSMVGFALLMVGSLLWMAHRVRKRGRIGPKSGAVLRSVYPLVLGLGGWFLGLLVIQTLMPSVPLDNVLLATVSIGAPIGLGIYYAWVRRDRPAWTKRAGFAAAIGGALVGAWLGFLAGTDLLGLITGIVGAAAGSNLAVIVFDIGEDRRPVVVPEVGAVAIEVPARVDV